MVDEVTAEPGVRDHREGDTGLGKVNGLSEDTAGDLVSGGDGATIRVPSPGGFDAAGLAAGGVQDADGATAVLVQGEPVRQIEGVAVGGGGSGVQMTVLKATEPSVWVTTTVEVWLPLSYAASPA